MRQLLPVAMVAILGAGVFSRAIGAELSVQEVVGSAFSASSENASGEKLESGTVLESPRFIRTGPDGRIELNSGDGVVRLGANSAVEVRAESLHLERGSAVFAGKRGDAALTVQLADTTVLIEGETGFVHVQREEGEDLLLTGTISGKSTIETGSRTVRLRSGDLVVVSPERVGPVRSFDLPQHLQTAPLLNGFQRALPTADKSVARSGASAALSGAVS